MFDDHIICIKSISKMSTTQSTDQTSENTRKPQFCYIREPNNALPGKEKRFISIALSYDQHGNVKYGASIFRREKNDDLIVKKNLRKTALERFQTKPVEFTLPSSENQLQYKDVVRSVRKTMHTLGVKSKQ